jgi:membrane peptidoglycan carboxypeptidase
MTNVITTGTGRAANPGFVAAGKTGTTQSYRDAWFIGFTPTLVAGVWFGNDDGSATRNVTGSNLPAQTWRNFMIRAVANEQRVAFDSEAEKPRADPNSIWQRIVKTFSGGNTSKQPPTRRQNVPAYPTGGDQPRP